MSSAGILVNVDDNEPVRYARNRILSRAGFQVHDAGTGREAMDLVERHQPDLVLLDVHLPDVSGIEVCRQLKDAPNSSGVVVLQISSSAVTPNYATAALDNGADAYLIEPVDPDVLVATVRAMLRLRQAERALAETNRLLEAANRDLRRSNEDLQQFAFVASHDLQEPLRTVTTFVQLIEEEATAGLTEVQRGYLAHVVAGASRMRSLISDLLAYSQVGRDDRKKSPVNMSTVVAWAVENLGIGVEEAAATIHVHGPLPKVWGDFAQLGQVMQNVLGNALKYRKQNEPLHVNIRADAGTSDDCVIAIEDNGIGIAPEYHEKIFAPFKRLHGQEIPGTGIGLAVCRRIIDAHEGSIGLESKPDVGSTFFLRLPCGPQQ